MFFVSAAGMVAVAWMVATDWPPELDTLALAVTLGTVPGVE
jgi:hypothetical protein